MKVCTKCARSLPVDQFHANGKMADGRKNQCRDCCKQYQADRLTWLQHNTPEVKLCADCRLELPAATFARQKYSPDGLQYRCKGCMALAYQRRKASIVQRPAGQKRCPRCRSVLPAASFAASPNTNDGLKAWCRECSRLHQIERLYKLTADQYLDMTKNGCEICGSFDQLHVDHDHACCPGQKSCGKCVRGILCNHHNQGLGYFRDDPEALETAATYLRQRALGRTH